MSVNLLDLVKGHLTDAVVDKAASFLGESGDATKSGLGAALPALLGGLMNKASSQSGASDLLGMVTRSEFGGDLLGNLGGLFGGSNNNLMNLSGDLLGSIFGDKLGGITDLIGNAAGLKSGSSSGLLKMALPVLMGVIGKKVSGSGLNAAGLANLLGGQKEYLEKAAPAGFMDKMLGTLGVGSLGNLTNNLAGGASKLADNVSNTTRETASRVTDTVKETTGSGGGGNKMMPLLALLAAGAIAFFAYRSCSKEKAPVVEEKIEEVKPVVEEKVEEVTSNIIEDANSLYNAGEDLVGKTVKGFEYLGEFVKRKLKDGTELIIPSKGFEAQLIEFIDSDKEVDKKAWFNMRRVLFKTGSADLDDRSMGQIDYVATILKAYPTVDLKLGGYTDNTGDPAFNKKLSADRATSVMKALIAKGIDAKRLSAEGYGQEHPIADNATEEGRQLNRRVAARVAKK